MTDLIQALLAFALSMLGFATIVTMVLEITTRLLRRRTLVLRHLLLMLFETEIQKFAGASAEDQKRAIGSILSSPIKPHRGIDSSPIVNWTTAKLNSLLGADQATDLTLQEFMLRLSRTEVGTEFFERAKEDWEAAVRSIEIRYEELSAATTEWFKSSSLVFSLMIGVAMAFALNINGPKLLEHFVVNPEAARKVTAEAELYLEEYEDAAKRLDKAKDASGDPAEKDEQEGAEKDLEEIQGRMTALRERKLKIMSAELPIGSDYYPYCPSEDRTPASNEADNGASSKEAGSKEAGSGHAGSAKPKCGLGKELSSSPFKLLGWFASILLTGLLIGLGGPFWYDTASGLIKLTQVMRGRSSEPTTSPQPPARAKPVSTEDLKTVFADRRNENDDAPLAQ